MLNLAVLNKEGNRRYPKCDAFVLPDQHLRFDQAAKAIVEQDRRPGGCAALSCSNLPFYNFVNFCILKTGTLALPISILLKRREVAYHLTDCEASLCLQTRSPVPANQRKG